MILEIIISILLLIISLYLFNKLIRTQNGLLLGLLCIYHFIQFIIIIIFTIFWPEERIGNNIYFKENISSAVIIYGALLLIIISIYIITVYLFNNFNKNKTYIPLFLSNNALYNIENRDLTKLSIPILLLYSLEAISIFIPEKTYILNIILKLIDFIPLFLGIFYINYSKRLKIYIILLLVVIFLLSIIGGNRGKGSTPIFLFVCGYIYSNYRSKKTKYLLMLYSIMLIPFLNLFSFVQDFRSIYGRDIEINSENIELFFNAKIESTTQNSAIQNSLQRILGEGNLAVITMTPKYVDYRGTKALIPELISIFSLTQGNAEIEEKRENRAEIGYGNGILTKYGFRINKFTSTGLGYVGDSYSRFGILGVIGYTAFIGYLILGLQKIIYNRYNKRKIIYWLLISYLIFNSIFTVNGSGYIALLRSMFINGLLLIFLINLIYMVTNKRKL